MRITTWNVNSIRARLDRAVAWVERAQPDLLCLQELKCEDHVFPRERFEALGLHLATYGQKTYNGVGLISRSPLEDVVTDLPLAGDPQARGIAATVDGVRVVNLYVPNGSEVGSDKYAYKLAWLDALLAWVSDNASPDDPLVICGDFNITRDDRDIYDPEAWREKVLCSTPERERLEALLDWGLTDAFRHFDDSAGQYTWWDYRNLGFQKRQGMRIDHLLVTAPVLARAASVVIDRDERRGKGASDHAPVVLELGPVG